MSTAKARSSFGTTRSEEHKKQRRRTGQHFEKQALHPSKVPVFLRVFDAIVERVGGHRAAVKYIGMAANTVQSFKEGRLSVGSGKKILAAWEKVKNQPAEGGV
jgi:hypothetical protein